MRAYLLIAIFIILGAAESAAQTIRLALPELPPGLGYPYRVMTMPTLYTVSAVFDGLTRIDQNGVTQPWLAKTWVQKDPTTWVLTLRDDVIFHNGRPFTADAVVNVVTFLADRFGSGEAVATEMAFLHSAMAIDDFTVEIRTDYPVPVLPRFLPVLHMVEPESWRTMTKDEFALNPVGTGPFKVEGFGTTKVSFSAHEQAWRPSHVDELEILAVPDPTARLQGLISGSVDVALALGPDDRETVEMMGGTFRGWRSETVRTISFVLTEGAGPLDDVRVRQALNLAVNRQGIIDGLLGGNTIPASQGASPAAEGYNPDLAPIPYDLDRASSLLKDAGYEDGFSFTTEVVVGASGWDRAMYQQVARNLQDIGVEMIIVPITFSHLFDHFERGKWHGKGFGMVYSSEPVIDSIRPLRNNSCLRPIPWYCNTELSAMIDQALTEQDVTRRISLKQEVLSRYRDEAPAIFLWPEPRFAGLAKEVTGYNDVHGFISYDTLAKEDKN